MFTTLKIINVASTEIYVLFIYQILGCYHIVAHITLLVRYISCLKDFGNMAWSNINKQTNKEGTN